MMKIAGMMVSVLVKLNPQLRGPCVVRKKTRKAPCAWVRRATHGMLEAAPLWHNELRQELESNEDPRLIGAIHALQTAKGVGCNARSCSMRTI
jgi:hypothetical protein